MKSELLRILDPGLGATFQDRGRPGWARFGLPPGGAMDDHAAGWANRLLDNSPDAPVMEFLLQGARIEALQDGWVALTGAHIDCEIPLWQATRLSSGQVLNLRSNLSGVWLYLAVERGFVAERWFGSASTYVKGKLGKPSSPGDVLRRADGPRFALPSSVATRRVATTELRDYKHPPPLRVWPGPQWPTLDPLSQKRLLSQSWRVSSRSDRVGYRLEGAPLNPPAGELISEPVCVGTVQLPPDGQPIVTMRDGPTVGGYPKIALVDSHDLSWLVQCRPGQSIRFEAVHEV